jgi:VWFA-related protein
MRRFTKYTGAVAVSTLAISTTLFSQSPAPQPPEGQVRLDVTVTTKAGDPVGGLTASDFTVIDNKTQQPITGFHELTGDEARTAVIIVLDDLNLPYSNVSFARQQIDQFLSTNEGQLAQPVGLAVMSDKGLQILSNFTTNGSELRATLDKADVGLRSVNRSTGFYGNVERFQLSIGALRQLMTQQAQQPGRKLILWVAPGWPLLSGPGVELTTNQQKAIFADIVSLSTLMREGQITLHAVNPIGAGENVARTDYYENFLKGVRDPQHTDLADLGLQVLAIQSGGLVLNGSNDIAALLQHSVAQTKSGYQISFAQAPGEHENEYHQVQVLVKRPGLTARTNTGYYARPTYSTMQEPPAPVKDR